MPPKPRTSCGKSGASASNLPMLPSLNVKSSFLIHSCGVPSSASNIGCMSWITRIVQQPTHKPGMKRSTTYEFTKVVDRITEESRDAEIVCADETFFARHIRCKINTGQVKQRIAVIWCILRFCLPSSTDCQDTALFPNMTYDLCLVERTYLVVICGDSVIRCIHAVVYP